MCHSMQRKLDGAYKAVERTIARSETLEFPDQSTTDVVEMEFLLEHFLKRIDSIKIELATNMSAVLRKYDELLSIARGCVGEKEDEEISLMLMENISQFIERIDSGTKQMAHMTWVRKKAKTLYDRCVQSLEAVRNKGGSKPANSESACSVTIEKLLEFDGKMKHWPDFWKVFYEVVDSKNIPDEEKLITLKECLSGEAKRSICYTYNYKRAIRILKDVYDQCGIIKLLLHKKLCSIPSVSDESMLPKFWEAVDEILQRLLSLGEKVHTPEILKTIEAKLPDATVRRIDDIKQHNDTWSLGMLKMLITGIIEEQEAARAPEDCHPPNPSEKQTEDSQCSSSKLDGDDTKESNNSQKSSARASLGGFRPFNGLDLRGCSFCNEYHYDDSCEKYDTIWARIQRANALQLCRRCLRKGHELSECRGPSKPCFYCKGDHVSAMCYKKPAVKFYDPAPLKAEPEETDSFNSSLSPKSSMPNVCEDDESYRQHFIPNSPQLGKQAKNLRSDQDDSALCATQHVVEFPNGKKTFLNSFCSSFERKSSPKKKVFPSKPVADYEYRSVWENDD